MREKPIDDLNLSMTLIRALKRAGIKTTEDLRQLTPGQVKAIKGVRTHKDFFEIKHALWESNCDRRRLSWPFNSDPVSELGLNSRAIEVLHRAGIQTVGELRQKSLDELEKLIYQHCSWGAAGINYQVVEAVRDVGLGFIGEVYK